MPSVDLVSQTGATQTVTDLGTLQSLVEHRGWSVASGTYADAVASLSGGVNRSTAPSVVDAVADPATPLGAALRAAFGLPGMLPPKPAIRGLNYFDTRSDLSFPPRVHPAEPRRQLIVVRNTDATLSVDVSESTNPNSVDSPTGGWVAVAAGSEYVSWYSTRAIFVRPTVTGASVRVLVYSEIAQ